MTERNRAEVSNPLSTVDDIQRRLLRPPSLHSPEYLLRGRNSLQFKEVKSREAINKKLEDYLDPLLLSTISAKINSDVKKDTSTKLKREGRDFEWPVDELKVLTEDSRKNEAVNLNDDLDLIVDGGVREEEICTPFRRFEQTALKRFKW